MTERSRSPVKKQKPISASDVGRYLKRLAILNKDSQTGNLALSNALHELAIVLINAKSAPADDAVAKFLSQRTFEFDSDVGIDHSELTLEEVSEFLNRPDVNKSELVAIGLVRFGIAKSQMAKIPKDGLLEIIRSALQHEESLSIISDEAKRGGQSRTS